MSGQNSASVVSNTTLDVLTIAQDVSQNPYVLYVVLW